MNVKKTVIILLAIVSFNTLSAQKARYIPDSLQTGWKLIRNQQGDSAFRCLLNFTNNSPDNIPASGWKIYFNLRYHGRELRSLNPAFSITHVSGELFFIQPTSFFQGLGEKKTISLEFTGRGRIANYQDIPTGLFWVNNREPNKAIALKKIFIQKSNEGAEELEKLSRPDKRPREAEKLPMTDQKALFDENKGIADIPVTALPKIFPTPLEYHESPGNFLLDKTLSVIFDDRFTNEAGLLAEEIRKLTGTVPRLNDSGSRRRIVLSHEPSTNPESYSLEIIPNEIIIKAGHGTGIFYGIQSLKSILPADVWSGKNTSIQIPCMHVKDAPQLPVREFMLDVARNFQSKKEILRILDVMSLYKLNVFHFHLTDDEGWRLAIPGLPELTDVGARRGFPFSGDQQLHPSYGSGPDGNKSFGSGYYTTEEFIEILEYAGRRHILVIPEIESPGHARAAIKSMDARYAKYIQAGDTAMAEQYQLSEPLDRSVYMSNQSFNDDIMNPALPSTYRFMEKVIDELAIMYRRAKVPLMMIHVGGDEVPRGVWEKSPSVMQWIKEDANRNGKELWRAYFEKINILLKTKGIGMTGWEELMIGTQDSSEIRPVTLNEGFIKDRVLLESWWNQYGNEDVGYKMANAGYPVILSFVDYFYFDLAHNKSFDEPGDGWVGYIDLQKVYSFLPYNYYKNNLHDITGDPLRADFFSSKINLTQAGRENIKGIQCALWGENLVSPELLEYLLLPRLLAMAERAWAKEPAWSRGNDPVLSDNEYRKAWSVFANILGKKELPKLDFYNGGYGYRIPSVAAVIQNGKVFANCELPGFRIRYTMDGSDPTINSPLYTSPLLNKGDVRMRGFDSRGRSGAVTSLINE